jgi:hypothetical protein
MAYLLFIFKIWEAAVKVTVKMMMDYLQVDARGDELNPSFLYHHLPLLCQWVNRSQLRSK